MVDRMIATVGDHQVSEESIHVYPTFTSLLISMGRVDGEKRS
jgi:hypothetical protein